MNRRNLISVFGVISWFMASIGVIFARQAVAREFKNYVFGDGGRYYTRDGVFHVVGDARAEVNGTTVIDLPSDGGQAMLLPSEPLANIMMLLADTRPMSWFSEGQGILTKDGFTYKVARAGASDAHVVTKSGVPLYVTGRQVSADAFGADPTGRQDSTEAFNRALKFCAARGVPGYSSGRYRISGTLAPAGRYRWDWGETVLDFTSATKEALTEIKANPQGSSTPQPSGKYVLFDTRGCGEAVNTGSLTINGSTPGNMKLASRAAIPADIVAITASEGMSADATWGTLVLQGCGHGLWQGDQRGSAPNILPYTRWQINYLKIQFCIHPIESGFSGNGLDDTFFSELRLTRNGGRSVLRGTDIGGGVAFINGLAPHADVESQKAATKAGSPQVTLSTGNPDIGPGSVIVIRNAAMNKAGGPCDFVARVMAKSGTALTLDRAPEVTQRGADILCDPPEVMLSTTQWRFQQTYLEEIHNVPMMLTNRSAIYGIIKISNGHISSRYDCGIVLIDRSLAKIALHAVSSNNTKVKSVVGVASFRNNAIYNSNSVELYVPDTYIRSTINSDPVRIISAIHGDMPGEYSEDASECLNQSLSLTANFLDGTRIYQRHGSLGGKPAYTVGGDGSLELGPPAVLRSAAFGGGMSSPAAGSSVKARGSDGYLQHPAVGGKRYRITTTFSTFDGGRPSIQWYGNGALVATEVIIARGRGRAILFADAPEGIDHVRLVGGEGDAYTIGELTVAEVLSI